MLLLHRSANSLSAAPVAREKKTPPALSADGLPPVETRDPDAVWRFVDGSFRRMYPGRRTARLRAVFRLVVDLFSGRLPDYARNDLEYHDLEHTMQATVCLVSLLEGRRFSGCSPP